LNKSLLQVAQTAIKLALSLI